MARMRAVVMNWRGHAIRFPAAPDCDYKPDEGNALECKGIQTLRPQYSGRDEVKPQTRVAINSPRKRRIVKTEFPDFNDDALTRPTFKEILSRKKRRFLHNVDSGEIKIDVEKKVPREMILFLNTSLLWMRIRTRCRRFKRRNGKGCSRTRGEKCKACGEDYQKKIN